MSDDLNLAPILVDIVHRLNNPIGAIKTRIELLKLKKGDLLKNDEYLNKFLERTEKDLNDVTKILGELRESFKPRKSLEPVSISQVITLSLSKVEIPNTVEVDTQFEEAIPYIQANEIRLTSVFWNLIDNALRAMSNKGKLSIVARKKGEKSVEIDFTDTGHGILPDIRPSLFEPLSSSREAPPHGLGLWWCRTYLLTIGGEIMVVSTKAGEGTTFRVTLPIPKSKA